MLQIWSLAVCACAVASVGVEAVTQQQLAQYVAAQQTSAGAAFRPHPQHSVAVVPPRTRQAYSLQAAAEEDDAAYQQAYQAAYQQAAAAYQPQASSYKTFSSSAGAAKGAEYPGVAAAPLYYRPAPQAQPLYQPGRKLPVSPGKEPEEDYDPNPAYQFSFDVKDDEFTNYQNRKEQREGDKISGSYSVVDSDGYIRTVTYTADPKEGFKADVSREPTDIRVKLPQPPSALPQQYRQVPQQYLRKQQTQQYLEASSPLAAQYAAAPAPSTQYAPRPATQSVAYVAPQFITGPAAQPQYKASGLSAYSGQHRLAVAKPKAAAIGFAAQQPTASQPILYQAYQP